MKNITIKEIAKRAGVSIGTVDRALHNRGKVSAVTAGRIKQICEECGYESNVVGRAMAMQRKEHVVAVVINARNRNAFSSVIYDGVEDFAKTISDYNVRFIFYDIFENTVSEMSRILDTIYESEIAGLIIKPLESPIIRYKLHRLQETKKVPVVTCTADIDGIQPICYVGQDHIKLGRVLACTMSKFIQTKAKIIILVGSLSSRARREKLEGFLQYLDETEIDFEICNICEVSFNNDEVYRTTLEQLNSFPEANAIYLHVSEYEPVLQAIDDYKNYNGLTFSFGHRGYTTKYIKEKKLAFAVYEDPYNQGYGAGEAMFNYILNGEIPQDRRKILDGRIVFDENC